VAHRQENPVKFLVGCIMGGALVLGTFGGEREPEEVYECDHEHGGILLFGPSNSFEKAINGLTGMGGYSHVGLLLGLTDKDGKQLLVDAQPQGVRAIPIDLYDGRKAVIVPLDERTLAHARGAALGRLGRPYRGGHNRNGLSCGELVYHCMPRALQGKIKMQGSFPTPNSIAKAFGIETPPTETVGELTKKLKF
jgi:hypothetical protein